MGELEQGIREHTIALDEERGALEDTLDCAFFGACRDGVLFALRDLETGRETMVAALERGMPEGTAAEAGRLGSLVSLYGDRLEYLSDMITPMRDRAEQDIRRLVHGRMSTYFDDFYGLFGRVAREYNTPSNDIDQLTDARLDGLDTGCATLAEHRDSLCGTLAEIDSARTALDHYVRAQVAILRTRRAAFALEKSLHMLRLVLSGERIAISEA